MFINNLTQIIKSDILKNRYYTCDYDKAKNLILNGFIPISVEENQYYIFYKNELLMDFLQKGEIK